MMYRISDDIRKFLEKNFFETEPIFDRIERLIDFLEENEVKESFDRIIRSVLFLAAANENLFLQYLELARLDYRDLIYLAEYEGEKQVRDFSQPFVN